ncbi:MAG: GNAT family N-acetyltransferase [Nitrospiraceae bacterium]
MSKIVLVDDSYSELQMMEGYLKSENYTVVSYPNTDKLEDKLVVEKPDCIVMDVVMPGRNGFQACRDIKNDDRFKTIPIVLLTSKGQESDKFWGQQQGASEYVVKPFKPEDLLGAVRRAIPLSPGTGNLLSERIDWVCVPRRCWEGPSVGCTVVARLLDAMSHLTSRVTASRWVRYRIDLGATAPPPPDVHLTPVTDTVRARLQAHPDYHEPGFIGGSSFWEHQLPDAYVWLENDQLLCFQCLLTKKDNPLRDLPGWGVLYPPLETDVGQVEKLWTFSSERHRGVAVRFEYALFEEARRRGLRTLLTHIAETNAAARHWADKTGWQAFGTFVQYAFDFPGVRNQGFSIAVHRTGAVPPVSAAP